MFSGFLRKHWPSLSGAAILLFHFSYFVLPSLGGRFRNDDAYNIYYFWSRGVSKLIRSIFLFFTTYYRPVGGVYFYSLYEVFGLDPLPYHIVIVILLFINVVLVYKCATLLSESKIIGWLCSLLMTYHARMALLAYVPAFVFDVLCFTFFFAALFYYVRIRCAGKKLKAGQILIFLLLYIAALESKEMAVSLPAMIMVYELLWHTPSISWKSVLIWLRSEGLPTIVSGVVTLCFIIGKSIGPDALSENPMYQVTITSKRFFESNVRYFKDLFYLNPNHWFNAPCLILVWALLIYMVFRLRRKYLAFAFAMTIIAVLPISFIPERGGAMLYIPSFGWAIMLAAFIEEICGFVSSTALLQPLNRSLARALPLLFAAGMIWYGTNRYNKGLIYDLKNQGREFWIVKEELETLLPEVKPYTQIAFYNDMFEGWDAKCIAELLYKDRTVTARLNEKTPLSLSELNKMDYVLAFKQQKIIILKRPGEVFKPPG
jgi:hypothetical protein